MIENFTTFYNWFFKIVNVCFYRFSHIPYINVFIGIFFLGLFVEVALFVISLIHPSELQPIQHGFLNLIPSGILNSKDTVPLKYMQTSDITYQSVGSVYSFGTDDLIYNSPRSLSLYGGSLSPIGSGGLSYIGSGGLGTVSSPSSFGGNGSLNYYMKHLTGNSSVSYSSISPIQDYHNFVKSKKLREERESQAEARREASALNRLDSIQRQENYRDRMIDAVKNQNKTFNKNILNNYETKNYTGGLTIEGDYVKQNVLKTYDLD